jgi:CHAT domain-containing protein
MVAGASWRNAIREKERELQQLENRLSSARGVASLYAPTIELEEAQALVPADAALLEYFIAGDELLVFVLRRDRVTVVRGPAQAEELAQRVGRVRFQLSRAARPGACEGARGERLVRDVRRELQALAAIVLEPLRAALTGVSRLAIIPHGPLHLVPFHALWDGEQYLIQHCEICYAPSASMMAHMASRSADSHTGVGVKALVAGISDEAAPLIAREAQRVAEIFGGCELLIERDATAERVTKAAAQAEIIHLACHGRYSTHSPLTSGLKLADRWLTVRDIYGMRLRADLVTLSGCDTGRAEVAAGDELLGLMRGFFAAGASSMLVSLWQVHDEIAAETMSLFYRGWYNGGGKLSGKAGALRQAQLAALAERPHPVFWAPFVLVGKL